MALVQQAALFAWQPHPCINWVGPERPRMQHLMEDVYVHPDIPPDTQPSAHLIQELTPSHSSCSIFWPPQTHPTVPVHSPMV